MTVLINHLLHDHIRGKISQSYQNLTLDNSSDHQTSKFVRKVCETCFIVPKHLRSRWVIVGNPYSPKISKISQLVLRNQGIHKPSEET